jgi:hypothetical protein
MSKERNKIVIVSSTIQRCAECGWAHAPALLAYSEITRCAGFYCLDCFAEVSLRGDFDARKAVLA